MTRHIFLVLPLLMLVQFIGSVKAQNNFSSDCELSHQFEKIEIHYKKAEWFGKSNFKIGDYAEASNKTGITSVSQNGGGPYNEFKTKYNFTVSLKDDLFKTAKVKGNVIIHENLTVKRNSIFIQEITGIETESLEEQTFYLKTLNAIIYDGDDSNNGWDMHFQKMNPAVIENDTICYLSNKSRKIFITQPSPQDQIDMVPKEFPTFVFVENGNCLAEFTHVNIWFLPALDSSLKRIITASIIALQN